MKPKCFFRGCDHKMEPASQKETSPLAHFVRNLANETSKWEPDHETIDSVRRDLSFVKRQYTPTVKW